MTTEGRGARGGKTRLEFAVFSGAMCRTKLLPRSVFHTREHPQSSGSARGARPASNQIMRFLDAFAPGKSIAALRIPHKGTSTEQWECPRCKTRLESDYAVFQAQCAEQSFCRAAYSAQGNIHRAAGVLEGARPASNQIMRFFRRNAPNKASAALRIPHKGTSTEQRECPRGQGPPRIGFCGFLRRNAPNKAFTALRISPQGNIHRAAGVPEVQDPPRIKLCGFSGALRLKNRPAVTGMGDATRT